MLYAVSIGILQNETIPWITNVQLRDVKEYRCAIQIYYNEARSSEFMLTFYRPQAKFW